MLKAGRENRDFVGMLTELVKTAWEEKCVPQEWVEVVGKVVARLVQGRLERVAEEEHPESQCGF